MTDKSNTKPQDLDSRIKDLEDRIDDMENSAGGNSPGGGIAVGTMFLIFVALTLDHCNWQMLSIIAAAGIGIILALRPRR